MVNQGTQNLVLFSEDLQAIIVGLAFSETLIANHRRPQLELVVAQPSAQDGVYAFTATQSIEDIPTNL